MKKKKMSLKQAYQFVLDKRTSIRPNQGFMKRLLEFENTLVKIGEITLRTFSIFNCR